MGRPAHADGTAPSYVPYTRSKGTRSGRHATSHSHSLLISQRETRWGNPGLVMAQSRRLSIPSKTQNSRYLCCPWIQTGGSVFPRLIPSLGPDSHALHLASPLCILLTDTPTRRCRPLPLETIDCPTSSRFQDHFPLSHSTTLATLFDNRSRV